MERRKFKVLEKRQAWPAGWVVIDSREGLWAKPHGVLEVQENGVMKTLHWLLKHLSGCKCCRKTKGKEIGVGSGTNKLWADKATKD